MGTPASYKWLIGSIKTEGNFGVAMATADLTDWYKIKEADFSAMDTTFESDDDEINGYVGGTLLTVQERKGTMARKAKASIELITWALGEMLGNVTSSGSTPNYVQTIKWRNVCAVNPPSFSFIEGEDCVGQTATNWLYKGCVINTLTLEFNGKGPGALTLALMHDGSETAQASVVFPVPAAAFAVNKLFGYHLTTKLGPLGTEDITPLLRTWKMTINSGIVEPPSMAAGVYVAEYQYGPKNPKIDIEITLKANKGHAIYGYYQASPPTVLKHVSALTINTNRSITLTQSSCLVTATAKPSGNEVNLDIKIMEQHNATDSGPGAFVCKTGFANLLTPSP